MTPQPFPASSAPQHHPTPTGEEFHALTDMALAQVDGTTLMI